MYSSNTVKGKVMTNRTWQIVAKPMKVVKNDRLSWGQSVAKISFWQRLIHVEGSYGLESHKGIVNIILLGNDHSKDVGRWGSVYFSLLGGGVCVWHASVSAIFGRCVHCSNALFPLFHSARIDDSLLEKPTQHFIVVASLPPLPHPFHHSLKRHNEQGCSHQVWRTTSASTLPP